jgi:hypothetical protein
MPGYRKCTDHTFGAHKADKHMSLATLQELMGHKKKGMTREGFDHGVGHLAIVFAHCRRFSSPVLDRPRRCALPGGPCAFSQEPWGHWRRFYCQSDSILVISVGPPSRMLRPRLLPFPWPSFRLTCFPARPSDHMPLWPATWHGICLKWAYESPTPTTVSSMASVSIQGQSISGLEERSMRGSERPLPQRRRGLCFAPWKRGWPMP